MAEIAATINPDWYGKLDKTSDSPADAITQRNELPVFIWGTIMAMNAGTRKNPKLKVKCPLYMHPIIDQ